MRIAFLATVAFVVSFSAVVRISRADDKKEDELKKFQGTWKVVDLNQDGESQMNDPEGIKTIKIEGDEMAMLDKGGAAMFGAKLSNFNPSASPAAIDVGWLNSHKKVSAEFPAIYKLDGDELTMCWYGKDPKKPRPEKLEKGKELLLIVLKRQK